MDRSAVNAHGSGTAPPGDDGVRIAELVGTLSYAADLGLGQPMDHCLRQTVITGRLAVLAGADERDQATTFYLGLLMNTHCHADAAEQATWFDDDISFKSEGVETLGWNTVQILAFLVRRLASHGSSSARAKRLMTFPLRGQRKDRPSGPAGATGQSGGGVPPTSRHQGRDRDGPPERGHRVRPCTGEPVVRQRHRGARWSRRGS
jgi:hypothetical protein